MIRLPPYGVLERSDLNFWRRMKNGRPAVDTDENDSTPLKISNLPIQGQKPFGLVLEESVLEDKSETKRGIDNFYTFEETHRQTSSSRLRTPFEK